jgi:endonuclease/exonuclease/phosphatase family metal-dependent hydrolase
MMAVVPYYADMHPGRPTLSPEWKKDPEARKRAAARLLTLRRTVSDGDRAIPPRSLGTLLLGTWNVREFDSPTWGARLPETYAYIAEIIDRFDLVAVQEVRDDLLALRRLQSRLGSHWYHLVSDVTEGKAGNRERLAFLYDSRKVQFLGLAGELVLPPVKRDGVPVPATQVARTPLMAAFQVGWTKFILTTVHILYGEKTAAPVARVEEIRQVARFLRQRSDRPSEVTDNFILLGDFNIFSSTDATMKALTEEGGFTIPEGVQHIPGTNVPKNKTYDQIAYRTRKRRFEATGRAGAFDFYEDVFTEADAPVYRRYIEEYIADRRTQGKQTPKDATSDSARQSQFRTWRTYQMSDHLPLWAEFRVDFANDYLTEITAG